MCCISWDFRNRTTTTLSNLYRSCSYYWATELLHAACTWILNTDHLVPMKRTPAKLIRSQQAQKLMNTFYLDRTNSILAQKNHTKSIQGTY